jgi:hypothetical protein
MKLYTFIRENGNWDNFDMLEIEKFCCTDGNEARARERVIHDMLNATLNSQLPNSTSDDAKELRIKNDKMNFEMNKDKLREISREYYKANKPAMQEANKQYRILNKDKLSESKKEYHELNKVKLNEGSKEYRKINAEQLKAKQAEKINCECGSQYSRSSKNKHIATLYHQSFVNQSNDQLVIQTTCICGGHYTKCNKTRHDNTVTHKKFIESHETL